MFKSSITAPISEGGLLKHVSPKIVNNPVGNYMFKVNTRTRCEICSKLTIKTRLTTPSLLLTLNIFHNLL